MNHFHTRSMFTNVIRSHFPRTLASLGGALLLMMACIIWQPGERTQAYGRLTINAAEGESFALPEARVGSAYEFQFQTEGGLAPLKWSIVAGAMPPGLGLEENGKLRGVPSQAKADAYAFVVEVADAAKTPQRFSVPCLLLVNAAPLRVVTGGSKLRIVTQPVDTNNITESPSSNSSSDVSNTVTAGARQSESVSSSIAPAPSIATNSASSKTTASPQFSTALVGPLPSPRAATVGASQPVNGPALASSPSTAMLRPAMQESPPPCYTCASLIGLAFGGAVLSQQSQNFSQADPFGGFTVGYAAPLKPFGFQNNGNGPANGIFNFRFQGVFTAEPRTAMAPTPTPTATPTPPTGVPTTLVPFLASRKTFDIEAQLWTEIFLGTKLSVGPYGAWGGSSVMSKNEVQADENVTVERDVNGNKMRTSLDTTRAVADNDMKQHKEIGAIFHLHLPRDSEGDKLFAKALLAYGHYEGLKGLVPGHNTQNRFIGRLSVFPLGLSRTSPNVEKSPLFGVEVNAGYGQDQVKFFLGYIFSFPKILK